MAKGCYRSTANYPALVARKLGARLEDRSCGGARTTDFRRSQYPEVPPQLTAVKPGVELVTVSIGGNDERVFSELIVRCTKLHEKPAGAPCASTCLDRSDEYLALRTSAASHHVRPRRRHAHQRRSAGRATSRSFGRQQVCLAAYGAGTMRTAKGHLAMTTCSGGLRRPRVEEPSTVGSEQGHDCPDTPGSKER